MPNTAIRKESVNLGHSSNKSNTRLVNSSQAVAWCEERFACKGKPHFIYQVVTMCPVLLDVRSTQSQKALRKRLIDKKCEKSTSQLDVQARKLILFHIAQILKS